ncbi:MAG TPA: MBL fold metallo-hydrolase [Elusimicrobiota bacterium]|nr:MBL fold metallo-hydrolase [Elusimicrobiota bacterium]
MSKKAWTIGFIALLAVIVWVFWFVEYRGEAGRLSALPEKAMHVVFLDVGYGDCAWIRTPNGENFLIDAGPGTVGRLHDFAQTLYYSTANVKISLGEYLASQGVRRLRAVFVSHSHFDHWGGLNALLSEGKISIGAVYESTSSLSTPAYDKFKTLLSEKGVPVIGLFAGQDVAVGDPAVSLKVLGPRHAYLDTGYDLANRSLILRLTMGDVSVLFPGDIGEEAEFDVLEVGELLRSTVLKISTHASRHATSTPFLDGVDPSIAVISLDTPNPFGTPHDDMLQKLIDRNIEYYRTDVDGDVTFVTDGKKWRVSAAKRAG